MDADLPKKPLDVAEGPIVDSKPWEDALKIMVEMTINGPSDLYMYRRCPTEDPVFVDSKTRLQSFYFAELNTNQVNDVKWVALPPEGGCLEVGEVLPSGEGFKARRQALCLSSTQWKRLDGIKSLLGDMEQGNTHAGCYIHDWFRDQYYQTAFLHPEKHFNISYQAPLPIG